MSVSEVLAQADCAIRLCFFAFSFKILLVDVDHVGQGIVYFPEAR